MQQPTIQPPSIHFFLTSGNDVDSLESEQSEVGSELCIVMRRSPLLSTPTLFRADGGPQLNVEHTERLNFELGK